MASFCLLHVAKVYEYQPSVNLRNLMSVGVLNPLQVAFRLLLLLCGMQLPIQPLVGTVSLSAFFVLAKVNLGLVGVRCTEFRDVHFLGGCECIISMVKSDGGK